MGYLNIKTGKRGDLLFKQCADCFQIDVLFQFS